MARVEPPNNVGLTSKITIEVVQLKDGRRTKNFDIFDITRVSRISHAIGLMRINSENFYAFKNYDFENPLDRSAEIKRNDVISFIDKNLITLPSDNIISNVPIAISNPFKYGQSAIPPSISEDLSDCTILDKTFAGAFSTTETLTFPEPLTSAIIKFIVDDETMTSHTIAFWSKDGISRSFLFNSSSNVIAPLNFDSDTARASWSGGILLGKISVDDDTISIAQTITLGSGNYAMTVLGCWGEE